jgi:hypothetical protein
MMRGRVAKVSHMERGGEKISFSSTSLTPTLPTLQKHTHPKIVKDNKR